MKVLFLASWYPSSEDPIDGIFIRRHAESVANECDITVISYHPTDSRKSGLEISQYNGIKEMRIYQRRIFQRKPHRKALFNIFRIIELLFFIIYFYKGFRLLLKTDGKPDIVHLNVIYPMGFFALFVNLFYRIPYIVTEHTSPFKIYHDSFIKKIFSLMIIKRAKFILPVSQALKKEMQVLYDTNRYVVIPNIVDSMFSPEKTIEKEFHSKKNIIHVSLLDDSQKNISGIIYAMEEVSKTREDFHLQIVGEGIDKKELEILAGKCGLLNSVVSFSGRLSGEPLIESYRHSCFFVLNSYQETFAIVCAEALACGIPVVSTRCGGPEEYIDEKMGILIDVKRHDQLVAVINYMLDHYQDYNPLYLHDSIRSKFSPEIVGEQIMKIYQQVLAE